ncbi:MAG: sugar ABC transporter permease [Epulopiscium sp.]|nr:sugar ABC transporter permease [Candidatus Epulonipiscium sp.]
MQSIQKAKKTSFIKVFKKDYQLYLLALPAIIFFVIFHYIPMYGVQIAFKDFIAVKGITGSPWVGFKHFNRFFTSFQFWRLMKNTLGISIYQLIASFPIPIIMALLLNQTRNQKFKKVVQTVTYAPHFISVVVLTGMMYIFLSPRNGIVNQLLMFLGQEPIFFLGDAKYYKSVFVFSGVWQNAGWGSIIYLAALSGINTELYEAAKVDGATKLQTIWNIDIPGIMPTAVILLIMNVGRIMDVGFQKAYLLQNPLNVSSAEIISTYIYKIGLIQSQFSYSTAIGLFNTVINIILLVSVNKFAKKVGETSLW